MSPMYLLSLRYSMEKEQMYNYGTEEINKRRFA